METLMLLQLSAKHPLCRGLQETGSLFWETTAPIQKWSFKWSVCEQGLNHLSKKKEERKKNTAKDIWVKMFILIWEIIYWKPYWIKVKL